MMNIMLKEKKHRWGRRTDTVTMERDINKVTIQRR